MSNTDLIKFLIEKSKEEIVSKNFDEVVKIYSDLFLLTKDYRYKIDIANIYYKIYNDIETATRMYEEAKPFLESDSNFWWQYHEIQLNKKKYYEATYCVYKALEDVDIDSEEDNING